MGRVQHKICTNTPHPIRRQLAPARHEVARQQVGEMLETGIIKPSESPWASPVNYLLETRMGLSDSAVTTGR